MKIKIEGIAKHKFKKIFSILRYQINKKGKIVDLY